MKRIDLRDIPDEVYASLAESAQAHHQSLNAFVVDRLTDVAPMLRLAVASYEPPPGTGITIEDAVATLRQARDAGDQQVDGEVRRPTTHVVSFRLDSREMELLEAAADESELKLSHYVRRVLFDAASAPPTDFVEPHAYREDAHATPVRRVASQSAARGHRQA